MSTSPVNGVDPLIGQSLGQFEIVELIGRGGMGAVYKARQPSLDRWVAIKILSPALSDDAAFVARFTREARAAAAVSHRNVIEIIDVAAAGGCHYIAMGCVDGESLAAFIEREGRLLQDRALAVMKQAVAGLAAAHRAGIIHRDIKPSNILLDRSGEVRVSDFGLAKRLAADAATSTDEQPLGTPAYVSPEMATGKEVDARTDLYSFGATFFHALAGRPPFEGESFSDLIVKVVREPAPPLAEVASDVDPRLCAIVDRLLRKEPAERPPSAQALLDELEALGELHSPAKAAQDEAHKLLREAPTVPLTQGRRLAHKAAMERLRREREKSGKRRLLLAAAALGVGLIAALALPRLLRPSGAPSQASAAAELRERSAQSLFSNAKTAQSDGDWAAAEKWLDELVSDYSDTQFLSASREAVEALRRQIARGKQPPVKQPPVPPPPPEVQVRVDEAARTVTTDQIKVRWDPDHANRVLALELNSGPGMNLTTPVVLRPEASGGCEFTGNAATADDPNLEGLLIGLQCGTQQWTSRYLDSTRKRAEVATKWQRAGRAPVETSFWFAADSARIDFQRAFRFSLVPHTNRLNGLIPFYWYTNGLGLPFTYSRAGKEPGRATAQGSGLPVADWDGRWADMGQIAYFHKPCGHAVTLYGDWDGQSKGSRAAPALSEMRAFTSDVTIRGALFLHEQGLGAEEIEKEYDRFLKQFSHGPAVEPPPDRVPGEWVSLFDGKTLDGWRRVDKFPGAYATPGGEVRVTDGQLRLEPGRGHTAVAWTREFPDSDYEITAEAMRVAGEFDIGSMVFPVAGSRCIWMVGGYGFGGCTGLEMLDGRNAGGNETTKWTKFEVGRWYALRLRVTKDRVEAWIDGAQTVNLATAGHRFADRDFCAPMAPFGIFTYQTTAALRNIRLRRLAPAPEAGARLQCRLLATLTGHTDWVTSVAFSPDGTLVASASRDRTVKLWEPATGKCLKTFQGHLGWAECVAFSPDGKRLASASMDGTVRVWDVETARCLATLDHRRIQVRALAFPPDGKCLVSGADDGLIRFWDVAAEKCLKTMTDPADRMQVQFLAFSADGKRILTCGNDGTVRLWDAAAGTCLRKLSVLTPESWCVGFSPDGQRMLSVGNDLGVRVWSADTGAALKVLPTPTVNRGVALSPDGRWIAASGWHGWLHFWDAATYEPLESLRGHQADIFKLAFSPDSKRLASAGFDSLAKVWELVPPGPAEGKAPVNAGEWVSLFDGKTLDGWSVVKRFGGVALVNGGGAGGEVYVKDGQLVLEPGRPTAGIAWTRAFPETDYEVELEAMRLEGDADPASFTFPAGQEHCTFHGACYLQFVGLSLVDGRQCHENGTGRVIRYENGRWYRIRLQVTAARVRAWIDETPVVDFARAGHALTPHVPEVRPFGIWNWDAKSAVRSIRVRRLKPEGAEAPQGRAECRLLVTLRGHATWVVCAAFSPDGNRVASGAGDRTVKLWDVATGQCLKTFHGHLERVESVAFSPDGQRLFSSSFDKTVRIWDVNKGECIRTLVGHTDTVSGMALSPNGKLVASGSADERIRIWDTATGECVRILADPTGPMHVRTIAFSRDGSRIVSGGHDGHLRLWDVETGRCLRKWPTASGKICAVVICPDGERIVSVGDDLAVKLWSLATGAGLKVIETAGPNRGLAVSPDGKWIATGTDYTGILRFWDAATFEPVCTIKGHQSAAFKLDFSPDSKRLASASFDGTVKVWAIAPGEGVPGDAPAAAPLKPLALPPGGQWLPLFDGKTLDGWRVVPGAGGERAGAVQVRDGQVVLGAGMPRTAIAWTGGFPTSDYEVRVEAARVAGRRDFCTIVFPLAATHCAWVVGGFGADATGIVLFDGSAFWNETDQRFPFQQGRWYQVRLRVTKARVQGWIDDEKVLDTLTAGHTFSLWGFLQPLSPFGIYSQGTAAALRSISVRAIAPGPDDGPRPDEPPAGAKPVESATLAVPARGAWYDTGLFLAQGKAYEVSASGLWGADFAWPGCGPEGQPWQHYPEFPIAGMVRKFALIGRVGALGRPFHIGEKLTLPPPMAGRLYLRMNDFNLVDNWGGLRVTVAGPLLAAADAPILAHFTNEVRKLSLDAKSDWADSGVAVQPGQDLLIAAAGTWQAGPLMPPADADGYRDEVALLRRGALVGKIGEQGRPFYIGQILLLEPTKAGKLYLAMNDDARDDNQGSLTVTISAPPTRPKPPNGKAEAPPPPPPKTPQETLHAALKAKNPDYTGKGKWKAVGADLEEVDLKGCNIADLSPLKGAKITGQLDCPQNRIRDLGPLAGMPLSHLVCSQNQIADLSPLKGMNLLVLSCAANQIADLSPLDGMKLRWLDCAGNRVKDLAPLKGMPLERLDCGGNQIADLSPILGLRELRHLDCSRNPIAALPPLKGTSLVFLECSATRVTDLSPLAGSQLKALGISGLGAADLLVLRDLPLVRLAFSPDKVKGGLAVLRQHKTLRFLGLDCPWQEAQTPVEEFWKQSDAKHGKN